MHLVAALCMHPTCSRGRAGRGVDWRRVTAAQLGFLGFLRSLAAAPCAPPWHRSTQRHHVFMDIAVNGQVRGEPHS